MAVTKLMTEIAKEYDRGVPVDVLSKRYSITVGSVLKKVHKVRKHEQLALETSGPQGKQNHKPRSWSVDIIRLGIEKFVAEKGVMPTSRDFDESEYLPSARQIQRAYGGLVELRKSLGYKETDFTKGELRKTIAINANKRGLSAEDYFEPLLVEKFGEPFVHVQKRYYKGSKCRYDFLVYSKSKVFGIDIFTTDRLSYIEKNIRHKISRYKNAPPTLDIYFVLVGDEFTDQQVQAAASSISELVKHPNMKAMHELSFIELLGSYEAHDLPNNFLGLETIES